MPQLMGSQRARHDLTPKQQQQFKNIEENYTQTDWLNPLWKSRQSEERENGKQNQNECQ